MIITDLKQGVKNPNRINVFVDSKYAFSLDIAQVVELKVKVGRELSEGELAECKKASEYGKAYQRALEWALMRPRSVRELRDYLKRSERKKEVFEKKGEWERERELAEAVARGEDATRIKKQSLQNAANIVRQEKYNFGELIVERLQKKGYVDDKKFAEYYVENRFVKKGISKKRLKLELIKKGVSEEIIQDVLGASGRNDAKEMRKIIAKKRARYDDEKLIAYLVRQGFSYSLVRELVEEEGDIAV